MQAQAYNAEMVENLATAFPRRNEASFAWGNAISYALQLHGLRSFWPGVMDENGSAIDLVRGMTLTNTGPATITQPYLTPMFTFTGAEYLHRADEAALRIYGTETYIPATNRGMTIGFWCVPGSNVFQVVMAKHTGGGLLDGWWLIDFAGVFTFAVGNGAALNVQVSASNSHLLNAPCFVVCRFVPNTSLDIWVNGIKTSNLVGIYGAISHTGIAFQIAAYNGLQSPFIGKLGYVFQCASALSDTVINSLWHLTRPIFGV